MDKGMAKSRGNTNDGFKDISPAILDALEDELKQEHIHAYTIPVEWRQQPNAANGYGDFVRMDSQRPALTAVTRLRCPCGEEIDRLLGKRVYA